MGTIRLFCGLIVSWMFAPTLCLSLSPEFVLDDLHGAIEHSVVLVAPKETTYSKLAFDTSKSLTSLLTYLNGKTTVIFATNKVKKEYRKARGFHMWYRNNDAYRPYEEAIQNAVKRSGGKVVVLKFKQNIEEFNHFSRDILLPIVTEKKIKLDLPSPSLKPFGHFIKKLLLEKYSSTFVQNLKKSKLPIPETLIKIVESKKLMPYKGSFGTIISAQSFDNWIFVTFDTMGTKLFLPYNAYSEKKPRFEFKPGDVISNGEVVIFGPETIKRNTHLTKNQISMHLKFKYGAKYAYGFSYPLSDMFGVFHTDQVIAFLGDGKKIAVSQLSHFDPLVPHGHQLENTLNQIAEDFKTKHGFEVVERIPLTPRDVLFGSYTNVLMENLNGQKRVYIPSYGDTKTLNKAVSLYKQYGFKPKVLPHFSRFLDGSLRCQVQVLKRTPQTHPILKRTSTYKAAYKITQSGESFDMIYAQPIISVKDESMYYFDPAAFWAAMQIIEALPIGAAASFKLPTPALSGFVISDYLIERTKQGWYKVDPETHEPHKFYEKIDQIKTRLFYLHHIN